MDKQREEFEKWFKTTWNGIDLTQTIGDVATFQLDGDGKYFEDCIQHSWEAWQQAQKVAVPDGWLVVPREATYEMVLKASSSDDIHEMQLIAEQHKAMIEAGEKK